MNAKIWGAIAVALVLGACGAKEEAAAADAAEAAAAAADVAAAADAAADAAAKLLSMPPLLPATPLLLRAMPLRTRCCRCCSCHGRSSSVAVSRLQMA